MKPGLALKRAARQATRLAWVLLVMVGLMAAVALLVDRDTLGGTAALEAGAESEPAIAGWGAEALWVVKGHAERLSPISLANACGLGASSCARCHNDQRAKAPATDPVAAPWHHHHGSVNNSCVSCHQGNSRVLRQEVAHRNLLPDPLLQADKTCVSCHAADEVQALALRYRPAEHPSPSLSVDP